MSEGGGGFGRPRSLMTYISGDPHRTCDRCGFQRRVSTTSKEWTGLIVCRECRNPRPVHLDPPRVGPEGLPVPDARPDGESFLATNEVQPEDL